MENNYGVGADRVSRPARSHQPLTSLVIAMHGLGGCASGPAMAESWVEEPPNPQIHGGSSHLPTPLRAGSPGATIQNFGPASQFTGGDPVTYFGTSASSPRASRRRRENARCFSRRGATSGCEMSGVRKPRVGTCLGGGGVLGTRRFLGARKWFGSRWEEVEVLDAAA